MNENESSPKVETTNAQTVSLSNWLTGKRGIRLSKYQKHVIGRMWNEHLIIRIVIDLARNEDDKWLTDARGENDYERLRANTIQALLDFDLLKPVKDWRPSLDITIVEYALAS